MTIEPVAIRPDRPVAAWQCRAWELLARLPRWAIRLLGRLMLRLPRGSRVRRWCVLRASVIAWDATARNRYDLVLPIWDPACEWHWDATFAGLGFEELYRGHEGVKRSLANWNEIWTERSFTVREILDGGDTWVMRLTVSGRGARSGVPAQADGSSVVRLNPLIVYMHNFRDDTDALRNAGFGTGAPEAARTHP